MHITCKRKNPFPQPFFLKHIQTHEEGLKVYAKEFNFNFTGNWTTLYLKNKGVSFDFMPIYKKQ